MAVQFILLASIQIIIIPDGCLRRMGKSHPMERYLSSNSKQRHFPFVVTLVAPPQSGDNDTATGEMDFRYAIMESHNYYRTLHGSPPLALADDLNKTAQDWANVLAERNYLQYSETPGVGENIAILSMNGHTLNGDEVTKFWYNENINHDYECPRWRKDTHHFTQIVWKASIEFGVGVQKVKDEDKYVIVTHYRPPGNNNLPGEFKLNVQRPQT